MECVVAQRRIGRAIIVLASLSLFSAPACATQMLSVMSSADRTSGLSSQEGRNAEQGPATAPTTAARSRSAAAMPESAVWLAVLAGFGLLGAMSRRGTPHPLKDVDPF